MKTIIRLSLFCCVLFVSWTCSLERIDPSDKYDPCRGIITPKFTHDKLGISCDSPCVVKFTNLTTGAKSYLWEFGEGGTSTDKDPTYTFKKTGQFEVKLTAISDNCRNSWTEKVTVSRPNVPDPIPDFVFTFKNGNDYAAATVIFTNTSQNAVSYVWRFASATDSSTLKSPEYTYALAQSFNVTLEAFNSAGIKKQVVKTVVVKARTFTKYFTKTNLGAIASDVILTSDGGYAMVGQTGGTGALYTVKIDGEGRKLWDEEFPTADLSQGASLVQANDGGIVTVGSNYVISGGAPNSELLVVKYEPLTKAKIWSYMYGGTKNDIGSSIEKTADGGFIVCGTTASQGSGQDDIYLLKLTSAGIPQWTPRTLGDTSIDKGITARQTADGGYMVLGSQVLKGKLTPVLIKTDALGNKVGTTKFILPDPLKPTDIPVVTSMTKTSDGNYAFCGYKNPTASRLIADMVIFKTDSLGKTLWQTTFADSRPLYASRIQETLDGGLIVSGSSTTSFTGVDDYLYLVKFSGSGGGKLWDKSFTNGFGISSVKPTLDGGYIIVGTSSGTNVGMMVIKVDKDGIQ